MDEELRRKLQLSDSKRAELVLENHELKEQLERLRIATRGGSSSPARSAAEVRPTAVTSPAADLTPHGSPQRNAADDVGYVTITALPQPTEHDYGFGEEDHAKQCAEEIMSRLLRSLHTQREAQEKLAAAQLDVVRLQSLLDESRGREVVLSQMVAAYSDAVNTGSPLKGNNASTGKGQLGTSTPAQVEEWLQQGMRNLERLDGVKRRLVDEKLKETIEENLLLKASLSKHQGQGRSHASALLAAAAGSSSVLPGSESSPRPPKRSLDVSAGAVEDSDLLSEERKLLLAMMNREQDYQQRMQALKQLVLDREKTIHDLRKVLQAQQQQYTASSPLRHFVR